MNTLVVNFFAGPGAGKTTCAWEVASELKKKGINCEYVPEYPKELVWEENYELLKDQRHIFKEQARRLSRLRGKAEVIVTDSPILMNHIYGNHNSEEFTKQIDAEYHKYYNFNLFVQRDQRHFQQEGRIHDLEQSIALDDQIKAMVRERNLYCGIYRHENIKYVADNIIRNLGRIRESPPIEIKEDSISPGEPYDILQGKEINQGYSITDAISLNGNTVVMGYNPQAPEKYVTWLKRGEEYDCGHYFLDKTRAKKDLLQRALTGDEELAVYRPYPEEEVGIPEDNCLDKESFIQSIEEAIDYGLRISEEDYNLYTELITERAEQNSSIEDDLEI